jgi:endonuclease/exonuclease/phosphatase family metal-dependent hydrolase
MQLITWNIQWGRGVDGVVDVRRIVRVCRELGDADVLCFQEVGRGFTGLAGSAGQDGFAALAAQLPGWTAVEGIAVDALGPGGSRRQFGNLILSRRPVLEVFRHPLPWPPDPAVPTMPRLALEVVLAGARAPLRVTTSHLEYYSARQRAAQVERLRELQAEAAGHAADAAFPAKAGGPFEARPRPRSGILTGDFNFTPDDPLHARLQAPLADGTAYRDAWRIRHGDAPQPPTVGRYDKAQWPSAPFACDFILVTADLASRVEDVVVDGATQASDHQPVLLRLAE